MPSIRGFQRHSLSEHIGDNVIVLAFYPGDFGPLCDDTSSGLDALDLFSMQKDTTILAVSGDSVFSHRAFAEEYDLDMPLLADVHGEVAADYGVAADDDRYACRRAVFVVDNREQIEYRWVADDAETRPPTDEIRAAIEDIGDDRTALARYRVGHAHHIEGRRAFTSAMDAYEQREWMLATQDFAQATEEFDEAREEFNTAVRFSDDEEAARYFERAERKAEALWRAAGWLNDSAGAFASGEGRRGNELRDDAEGPLETARDIHKPPPPTTFPGSGPPTGTAIAKLLW
ncbi:redoxin domain-containing protein [Halovenus salina]|uniref:Redoxin domain-containing protein n=1 Tax=Halovenus salina TaxID=1510225 RepID=A0ABD5W029_9EURY